MPDLLPASAQWLKLLNVHKVCKHLASIYWTDGYVPCHTFYADIVTFPTHTLAHTA